jgi:hypothetical protein
VSEYPNTARGDAAHWGLTPAQAARYHARLSRMYADQATHFADLAVMYARRGERVALIGGGLVLLFAILGVIGAVIS